MREEGSSEWDRESGQRKVYRLAEIWDKGRGREGERERGVFCRSDKVVYRGLDRVFSSPSPTVASEESRNHVMEGFLARERFL